MKHLLHVAVAKEVKRRLPENAILESDEACGGNKHIPLFSSKERSRGTQLCKVDLLVADPDHVKVIIEIEESGFNPTKICGKFLTSSLATHFIHDTLKTSPIPFSGKTLFVQVLDGSKFLKPGSRKKEQCELIEKQINKICGKKVGSITDYKLFLVKGLSDLKEIEKIGRFVAAFV